MSAEARSLDLLDPSYQADPYGCLGDLREVGTGVHRQVQTGAWLVLRYDDVDTVFRDHAAFSSGWIGRVGNPDRAEEAVPERAAAALRRSLLFSDPPVHTRLRGLVSRAFTPRAVERLRPRVEQLTRELLADLPAGEELDLVERFAAPLPIAVIADMLGVPRADWGRFNDWSEAGTLALAPVLPPAAREAALEVALEFTEYMRALARSRAASPGDDMLSALVSAEVDGERLSENEVVAMVQLLLVAGNETTRTMLSNAAALLLANPEQLAAVRDEPGLASSTIEEVLRLEPPVQFTMRIATREVELGGKVIREGEGVMAAISSANRDPRQFVDAERFDARRSPNRHLSFAHGIHFCLGAPLARMEGHVALPLLLERFGRASLTEELSYRHEALTRGLPRLLVRL